MNKLKGALIPLSLALLCMALIFNIVFLNYSLSHQLTPKIGTLDQTAANFVRLSCLDMDYQFEHPKQNPPCDNDALCFSSNPTAPQIRFYAQNKPFGTINCLDYQNVQ